MIDLSEDLAAVRRIADELAPALEDVKSLGAELASAIDDNIAGPTCGCGCGEMVSGRQRYRSSACKQRAYRRRLRGA